MRARDIVLSLLGLIVLAPLILAAAVAVWWQDGHSPFYFSKRVGKDHRLFSMVKLRSMVVAADKSGVTSTSTGDKRITRVGHLIRRYKLDEIVQLWNVLNGEMSLVGPRPQVMQGGVEFYTAEEQKLLSVRPGITDLASVVFADEGQILAGSADPDLRYNQVIRPWKSRLGLFYVENRSLSLDLRVLWLTVLGMLNKRAALDGVCRILEGRGAPPELVKVAYRKGELYASPPPGAREIVQPGRAKFAISPNSVTRSSGLDAQSP